MYQLMNLASAAYAREYGFPPLEGTPKQIAWAETIRYEKFWEWNFEMQDNLNSMRPEAAIEQAQRTMELIYRLRRAKTWINMVSYSATNKRRHIA